MGLAQHITGRAVVVVLVTLYTLAFAITALVFSVNLYGSIQDLRSNQHGDPEREYVNECMRDFEHLKKTDNQYQNQLQLCIQNLEDMPEFSWLPNIRLAVDERVCDPKYLCSGGDPKPCFDKGSPREEDYQAGNVTQCFDLISEAKRQKATGKGGDSLDKEVESRCTTKDRWKEYENQAALDYCMWKHLSVGVCTNDLRADCAADGSCCPRAPQPGLEGATVRDDQYQCMKSPVVGLYCQHVNFRTEARPHTTCTDVTCPTFGWCRDFADIPGLCLTQACQDYRRVHAISVVCIVFTALGLCMDLADLSIFWRWPTAVLAKTVINISSASVKFLAFALVVAGSSSEFLATVVENKCFTEEGNLMTQNAVSALNSYITTVVLSSVGSLILSPFSMYWGGKLIGVPYTLLRT